MLAKRIIPCLDIQNGRAVKGTHFVNIRDAGDPVQLASFYSSQGADELVFLDITATIEKRKTFYQLVNELAATINIPFTVGGGISNVNDISILLQNGADKISINTSAYKDPSLVSAAAKAFGSQCVVVAIDAKMETDGNCYVYLNGGRTKTETNAIQWAKECVERGAGEILFTSIDHDGTKNGFANELMHQLSNSVNVPVIASGGAGKPQDFADVFLKGNADAALAASVFHYQQILIPELKKYLIDKKINVRI